MHARTRIPVAAVLGALVLSASAAYGQSAGADLPPSSDEPQVSVPPSPDEPEVSAPKPEPGPGPGSGPKPARPDSVRQAVDPDVPPAGAQRQGPYLSEPEMVYEPRWGLVGTGLVIMGPGLAVAGLVALAVGPCIDCNNYGRGATAELIALGAIEAVGAAFVVVGLVGHHVPAPSPQGRNLAFLPLVAPQTEGVSLRW